MKKIFLLFSLSLFYSTIQAATGKTTDVAKETKEMIGYSHFALGTEPDTPEKKDRREKFKAYLDQQNKAAAQKLEKQKSAAKKIQKAAKKHLAKKTAEKQEKAAPIIQRYMQKYHEKLVGHIYEEFAEILNKVPYDLFLKLICSGDYIDKTDWLHQFLEIRLNTTIFKTDADGSKDWKNFDDEFLKKISNPHDWLGEQIKHYLPEFHAACYQVFEKRATHEILENNMPWTQAVSIPAPKDFLGQTPGTPIYPVVYKCGGKKDLPYQDYENDSDVSQVDCIDLPLTQILSNVLKDDLFSEFTGNKKPYLLELFNLGLPASTTIQHGMHYANIYATIFDESVGHVIDNKYSIIKGEILIQLSNGSMITKDNSHLYYYKFNSQKNIYVLKNLFQYDTLDKILQNHIDLTYLSNNEKTLNIFYTVSIPGHTFRMYNSTQQCNLFIWNFETKNSPTLQRLLLHPTGETFNTDKFIVQVDRETKECLVFNKDPHNPSNFIKTSFIIPGKHDLPICITNHEKTNRIAIINHSSQSIDIFQLHENKAPEKIKTISLIDPTMTDYAVISLNWNNNGSLLTAVFHSYKNNSSIVTIFKTSDWSFLQKYTIKNIYASLNYSNPKISPNDKYILYQIKQYDHNNNQSLDEYVIQDLQTNQQLCFIQTYSSIYWNSNSSKTRLMVYNPSIGNDCIVIDLDKIPKKAMPSLIEIAFDDYALSLGLSPEQKEHLKRITSNSSDQITEDPDEAIADIEFLFEVSPTQQQIDAWYGNDFAKASLQIFLLGQVLLENNLQAFDELGGNAWLMQQPEEIQTIISNHLAKIQSQPAKKKIWQSAHGKAKTAVDKYVSQNK